MDTPRGGSASANSPAVLAISSGIWLLLGIAGTVWTFLGLLLIMVMGGMVAPEVYLPALALNLLNGAVFVTGVVSAVLLGRGRRAARLVLSAYVVILPALLFVRGGPYPGAMPWPEALLSPAGAVFGLAALATVLMWLPPASAFLSRMATQTLETPGGVPAVVTAAVWTLRVCGAVAALEATLGLVLLTESIGTDAKTTPAMILYLTLAAVAVADLACARPVRRGRPFVRPLVAIVPVAGLTSLLLATVAAFSNVPAGSPTAAGGLPSALLLTVLSQGLPLIGGLAAAVLVWLPSAGPHFRRGPAGRAPQEPGTEAPPDPGTAAQDPGMEAPTDPGTAAPRPAP